MSSHPSSAVITANMSTPAQTCSIRAMVVEANPVIREGLCSFLRNAQVEVVAQARNAFEAIELVSQLTPSIVLLSVPRLGPEHLAAMQAMRRPDPQIGIVVLSMQGDQDLLLQALAHGATCYLAGQVSQEDLAAAIRAAAGGRSLVDREALLKAAGSLIALERNPAPCTDPLDTLTPREREVLALLTEGLSNSNIASALGVSVGTIKTHICNILSKLHMADRVQAAVWATRRGLGPQPSAARTSRRTKPS